MNKVIKKLFSLEDEEEVKERENYVKNVKEKEKKASQQETLKVSGIIEQNEKYLKAAFDNCFDLVIKKVSFFSLNNGRALVVYLNEMAEQALVEEAVISRLIFKNDLNANSGNYEELLKYSFGINNANIHENFNNCVQSIAKGNIVIFVDTINKGFVVNLKSPPQRAIEEPVSEIAVRGPREGFTESLTRNVALIRKLIANTRLKTELFTVGSDTNSDIAIVYLKDAADEEIIAEVKRRINSIDLNSAAASNYIIECIEDDKVSVFPTIFRTEKPDIAVSKILEGKVIILVNSSPVALSVPSLFVEFMQSAEDYYIKYFPATLNRLIRYLSFYIATTLPGFYISLVSFHQELIPTPLVLAISKARQGLPFPIFIEAVILIVGFDIISEAGTRIPRYISQTIGIVGTIIIGEAAVRAKLVGPLMIIIVASSGIALFTIPSPEMQMAVKHLRYIFLFLAGANGMVGIVCGMLVLNTYLVSRRSFGVPYMFPIAPLNISRNQDTLVRLAIWKLQKRLRLFK